MTMYDATDTVPGAKNFIFKEGYSAGYRSGKLIYRVDPIPQHLIANAIRVFVNLQIIRDYFGRPVYITYVGCLYRSDIYNLAAGGARLSRHKRALASDTTIPGIHPMEIYEFAKENTEFKGFGIISAKSIHLDIRDKFWFKIY
jgi:hypothetical protein